MLHTPAAQPPVQASGQLTPGGVGSSPQPFTQWPVPSQASPPPWLQAENGAVGGFDGVPEVHRSLVHSFPSTGTSLSWLALDALPLPSQLTIRQSLAVCCQLGAGPADAFFVPQICELQAGTLHETCGSEHWASPLHCTQSPLSSQ